MHMLCTYTYTPTRRSSAQPVQNLFAMLDVKPARRTAHVHMCFACARRVQSSDRLSLLMSTGSQRASELHI